MSSSQWERVEDLFHAALQLEPEERDAYLEFECKGNSELRDEVASLVAESDKEQFFEVPAMSLGLQVMLDDSAGSLVGKVIGHYKILELLGSGGMGEVYLAEDTTLERQVALKFLTQGFSDDGWAKAQLVREARAVAQLDNSNICGIHGVEEIGEYNFIVMQYVDGKDMSSLLKEGALDLDQALSFAEQLASALAAAHSRGIIHRDVKPKNAIVAFDGQVKILDFGLAKYVQSKSPVVANGNQLDDTQLGIIVGTVAYMSPEQAQGETLEPASDVFSLGIFLYEMFGGKNPFLRETKEQTIDALNHFDPPQLTDLPDGFGSIIQKCLEKELPLRYADAGEVLLALQTAIADRRNRNLLKQHSWRPKYLRQYIAAACVVLVALLISARVVYVRASRIHSLVILPILNKSEDPKFDYLSEGLTRNIFEKLGYLPRLKVRLPTIAANQENIDPIEVGRSMKVESVLSGEILKQGNLIKLHLVLTHSVDGKRTWDQTVDLDPTNMLTLQDNITREVSDSLGLWLIGSEKRLLSKRQTTDEEALRLYAFGRHYLGQRRDNENVAKAISFFEQAVERDPAFAKAYSGLADSYVIMSTLTYGSMTTKDAMGKASYAARQVLDLEDSAEAHTSLGVLELRYGWNWEKAEQEFKRAIAFDPEYSNAHYWYANLLAILRRPDESIRESLIAKDLDPYSQLAEMNYGRAFYYAKRYDEAESYFHGLLEHSPEVPQFLNIMGLVQLQQGNVSGAILTLEKLKTIKPNMAVAALGFAYGKAGKRSEAQKLLVELDALSVAGKPVPPQESAIIYIGMGDYDNAFKQLEKSYSEHFSSLAYLTTDPLYIDLRRDQRYANLARRLGLPAE
jgi:serine/threonine protein kinase/Tfp pilus assembly protein PilF